MLTTRQVQNLCSYFGFRAIANLLNRDAMLIGHTLDDAAASDEFFGSLDEYDVQVLVVLERVRLTVCVAGGGLIAAAIRLNELREDGSNECLLHQWRQHYYGAEPASGAEAAGSLARLTIAAYPLLLITSNEQPGFANANFITMQEPNSLSALFDFAVSLFADDANLSPHLRRMTDKIDDAQTLKWAERMVISDLVAAAVHLLELRDLPISDAEVVCNELVEGLHQLARGGVAPHWRFYGIHNVALPQGRRVVTPWGILRPYSERMDQWLSIDARPASTGEYRAGCVLETYGRATLQVGDDMSMELSVQTDHTSERALQSLQLALVLGVIRPYAVEGAIPTEMLLSTSIAWTWDVSPVLGSGLHSFRSNDQVRTSHHMLSEEDLHSLEPWMHRLSTIDDGGMQVACRRLLQALNRMDDVDAFIDAVLVWEALYPGQGERVLRVSAGLALTLEVEVAARAALAKRAKGLYDRRSAIVHGGNNAPGLKWTVRKQREDADQSLCMAAQALRALYVGAAFMLKASENKGELNRFEWLIYNGGLSSQAIEPAQQLDQSGLRN